MKAYTLAELRKTAWSCPHLAVKWGLQKRKLPGLISTWWRKVYGRETT